MTGRARLVSIALLAAAGCNAPPGDVPQPAPSGEPNPQPVTPTPSATPTPAPAGVSACLVQDGARLAAPALKAVGTEPFWGAAIEGRCVTYSTPEDQQGTRVWTQFAQGADESVWTGALDGSRFELRAREAPRADCSDGMSDRRYRWRVTLIVRGETRHGCADIRRTPREPAPSLGH